MRRIKFAGFRPDTTVTMSAQQDGLTQGPVTVSAWKASLAGTFRARVSIVDETWAEVSDGDIIETVAPGRIRVWIDNFAGWASNDPRFIYAETDMGERYDLKYTDHADLPADPILRRLAGEQAGFYPGVLCGHAMRGTDMQGNQVLTADYNQSNGPAGTLDQTVTVYVSDGLVSDTITFTVRLVHPDIFYHDRTQYPAADGTVYLSVDGDFSDAPAALSGTPTTAGVYHVTVNADGSFDKNVFRNDKFPNNRYAQQGRFLLKAGETFCPSESIDPERFGVNGTVGTWYHSGAGGADDAILSYEKLAGYSVRNVPSLIRSNNQLYTGWRLTNVVLKISDYDVSDVTWREWWNVIKYTNKTGTIGVNTQTDISKNDFDGDTLSNGNGVYTEVISDDGSTLICRQIVNTANVDDMAAEQALFQNSDILTGPNGSVEFVAQDSLQGRTRKVPGDGVLMFNMKGVLFDQVEIHGAANGIAALGVQAVLSDVLVKNYWNYALTHTGVSFNVGASNTSWSEIGTVCVQPINYEGTPRFFGSGASPNRNTFNVVRDDGTTPATNDISHASHRFAIFEEYSAHYCFTSTYGGHGSLHQPGWRMGTYGSVSEGFSTVQMYGCGASGGGSQIHFGLAGGGSTPFTPAVIRIERSHLRSNFAYSGDGMMNSVFTNYVVRNCLMDFAADAGLTGVSRDLVWNLNPNGKTNAQPTSESYATNPDANAVQPVFEFCTFTGLRDTTPAADIPTSTSNRPVGQFQDVRGASVILSNNAFILDQTVLGTIDPDVLALADAPADFDSLLRPEVGAKAYQSGTGTPLFFDAIGDERHKAGFSKGAFEPV